MAGRAPSTTEEIVVRGVRHAVRRWGREDARPIVFLHGTQDSSVTFQFMVEHLRGDWCVIAPDWRGHGRSQWVSQGYWFHEFVADLDALLGALLPGEAVPLVGHSLGGNIASIYAGLMPGRVTHLISLDGVGPLTSMVPVDMRRIMGNVLAIPRSRRAHRSYPGIGAVADRLMKGNARLSREQALFLAEHTTADDGEGGRMWLFDPSHQRSLPSLHSMQEWGEIWSGITAPALWVSSEDQRPFAPTAVPGELERRVALMPAVKWLKVTDTGHNLHHDAPALMAGLVELFIEDPQASMFDRGVLDRRDDPAILADALPDAATADTPAKGGD